MANLKTSKKDVRSSARKRIYNDRRRKKMRELIKEFNELVEENKLKEAEEIFPELQKAIDKAEKRGVIKPKNAARKKSRFSKKLENATNKGK